MQSEFVYRGRKVSAQEIEFIRQLIAAHPASSRRRLSAELCAAWNWVQPNGRLRDMVCRGMLLMLERAGQITLPPVSYVRHNPLAKRTRPLLTQIDTTLMEDRLRNWSSSRFGGPRKSPCSTA